jgi:hypothetical protein
MEIIYKVKTSELNSAFIETLKKLFNEEEIIISIISAKQRKKTVQYSKRLFEAVENLQNGNFQEFSKEEFEKETSKLLKK